jgi:hypothetical protein
MLHEAAILQLVIERRPAVCQVDNVEDILQLARIFLIGRFDHLAHLQTGAGSAFHAQRLDALQLFRTTHRRNGVLRECARRGCGRACSQSEGCENNPCESIPRKHRFLPFLDDCVERLSNK